MKLKGQQEDFEGWLQAVNVAFKDEVNKLEKEKESLLAELLEVRRKIEGSEMQLRDAYQGNKDLEEELRQEKNM